MPKTSTKNRVIALIIEQQKLVVKVVRLVKDERTVGWLLADIIRINRLMLNLVREGKARPDYIRIALPVLFELAKAIISKWLLRYLLRPCGHLRLNLVSIWDRSDNTSNSPEPAKQWAKMNWRVLWK